MENLQEAVCPLCKTPINKSFNILIGRDTGTDLVEEKGYVILADNVSIQDVKERRIKEGIIYIGDKMAIQRSWLSDECPLKDIGIDPFNNFPNVEVMK